MTDAIMVAILSLVGTLSGTFGGIVISAKLTNYRLEQLEKKVEKHNNFAVRMPIVENEIEHIEREVSALQKYHK